jgi:hypothetical protein
MTDFLRRIKKEIKDPLNHRQFGGKTLVSDKYLQELVYHFESLDTAARADYDAKTPTAQQNRTACLAHEVAAAFMNLGAETTLDIIMFTISELRKHEIKKPTLENFLLTYNFISKEKI